MGNKIIFGGIMLNFNAIYSEMPESQIFSYLPKNNYEFLYKVFNSNKAYAYIDKSNRVNFCALCCNDDVMTILKSKKSIYVDKHNLGLIFKIKLTEHGYSYDFILDVFNLKDLDVINKIIENKEVMISFIVKQGITLNKAFHFNFSIDSALKERIEYIRDISYNMKYPRINEDQYNFTGGKFIEVEFDLNIVNNIFEICDKLSKWKSSDKFDIGLLYEENIKIVFSGECKNMTLIKDEIGKSNNIICEGTTDIKGVPLLKYNKGYLYFYEYMKKAN